MVSRANTNSGKLIYKKSILHISHISHIDRW